MGVFPTRIQFTNALIWIERNHIKRIEFDTQIQKPIEMI